MNIRQKVSSSWFALSRHTRVAIAAILTAAVAAGAVVGILSATAAPGGGRLATPAPSPSATPKPSTPAAPSTTAATANPLDNVGTAGSILAVKVDNVGPTTQAEQQGLNQADIVYWIQVEGGLSRYLAVYDSNHLPASVGPVRSARQTDIPLLQQYGKVDFAYSGAISGLLPLLAQADLANVVPGNSGALFSNQGESPTYINPSSVYAQFPGSAPAKDIGFRFGAAPSGGTPVNSETWHQPSASLNAQWNPAASDWSISADGVNHGLQAHTIVVQHVSIGQGLFTDHNAGHPDSEVFSDTVGTGQAQVLRDGQSFNVTWNRPTADAGTTYTLPNGQTMNFATGNVFVLLVP